MTFNSSKTSLFTKKALFSLTLLFCAPVCAGSLTDLFQALERQEQEMNALLHRRGGYEPEALPALLAAQRATMVEIGKACDRRRPTEMQNLATYLHRRGLITCATIKLALAYLDAKKAKFENQRQSQGTSSHKDRMTTNLMKSEIALRDRHINPAQRQAMLDEAYADFETAMTEEMQKQFKWFKADAAQLAEHARDMFRAHLQIPGNREDIVARHEISTRGLNPNDPHSFDDAIIAQLDSRNWFTDAAEYIINGGGEDEEEETLASFQRNDNQASEDEGEGSHISPIPSNWDARSGATLPNASRHPRSTMTGAEQLKEMYDEDNESDAADYGD